MAGRGRPDVSYDVTPCYRIFNIAALVSPLPAGRAGRISTPAGTDQAGLSLSPWVGTRISLPGDYVAGLYPVEKCVKSLALMSILALQVQSRITPAMFSTIFYVFPQVPPSLQVTRSHPLDVAGLSHQLVIYYLSRY